MVWNQFPEADDPRVKALDDSSARNEVRVAFRFGDFLAARADVRDMAAGGDFVRLADV
jgi:hypothetical protein